MVIYYTPKISPKISIYIGIGYAFSIIILFNTFMSTTAHLLNVPPNLYFHITKIRKLKGITLIIHSNWFYLWNILNILFITF